MIFALALFLTAQDRPVLRLDEALIQGNLRRPKLIEIKGSRLDQMVQEAALKNLIQLEEKLLKKSEKKER